MTNEKHPRKGGRSLPASGSGWNSSEAERREILRAVGKGRVRVGARKSILIFETEERLAGLVSSGLDGAEYEVSVSGEEIRIEKSIIELAPQIILLNLSQYPHDPEALIAKVTKSAAGARVMVVKNPRMNRRTVDSLRKMGVAMFLNPVTTSQEILFVINFLLYPVFKSTRKNLRTIVHLPLAYKIAGRAGQGSVFSLSKGGLFAQVRGEAAEGSEVKFTFRLGSAAEQLNLSGKVLWRNRFGENYNKAYPIGFASVFEGLSAEIEKTIDEFVAVELKRRYDISDVFL